MIGKQILHYKIIEKLGEGGMGVVYKAEDTKLERTVALKFLSLTSIGDEEKKRFKREAKAAASLNHPNIATIFAIDEADDQTFIAMEYIEGKSLEEIVETQNLVSLRDAIEYATQIAAGLQAAHEKGITHRDIKSANIMVTDKGVVKIMDFGLAKLANRSKMTVQGTTLGTAAYMSPEQAQGEKVDHRSDIWSLGVVLYEMISGQVPFKGDYEQAVIYSIQNEDPEPLTALRTGVPMDLEKIVNKLLAKDPRDRYQNIIELPVDLKNVSLQDTTASRIGSSITTDTITREKQLNVQVKYSYKTILTIAATAVVTFLLTWIFKIGHPPGPEPGRLNKMAIALPENHSLFFSEWNRMAISPDGRDIVYLGNRQAGGIGLFLKRADDFDVMELDAAVQARAPFFSPHGRWVGYVNQQTSKIFKILVDGGEPLKVASDVPRWTSATWAPDHTIIYGGHILKRVSDSASEPVILTKKKRLGEKHLFPHMLPDGKTVLFTVGDPFADLNSYRLALYRLDKEDYQIILDEEGYNAVYSTTGHILFGRANRLMAVPFDLESLRITGVPSPVLDNVQTKDRGSMSYALSAEGTLIFAPGTRTENDLRSIVTVDLSGQASDFFEMKKEFECARYSPNGQFVGFIIDDDAAENIWIYDIEGGAINQLTFYNKDGPRFFAWSPDSKFLAYATTAEDSTNSIYVKKIDGTGLANKIYTSPLFGTIDIQDWSEDGNKLSFDQDSDDTSWDLFVYSFQDSSAGLYLSTPGLEVEPQFSRNGEWLAYMSNESGTDEVYVRPYPKSRGGVWKISNGGGVQPVWSADGDKIYYRSTEDAGIYCVAVTATEAFSKRNPEKVFDESYWFATGRRWDIHPNGDRFLMIAEPQVEQELQKIFVIQNFDEELKRLVPVGKD